jgi:hypothetical protein
MRSFVKAFHWQVTRFGCLKEIIGKLNKGQSKNQPTYRDVKKSNLRSSVFGKFENLVIRDFCKGPNIRINQFVGKMPNTMINKLRTTSFGRFLNRPKYKDKPV